MPTFNKPHHVWACPICQQGLVHQPDNNTWLCENNHLFDCAKEGYVNLLPANKKSSNTPGDSAEMINARRRIHNADIYLPLAQAIQQRISQLPSINNLLDLGCGEGYYSNHLKTALPKAQVCAVDIAKPAIRIAAKRYPDINFAVASTFELPVASASQDLLIRIFAPASDEEIQRVLKPKAYYIEVTPAPQHLWTLRQALYETPTAHKPSRTEIPAMQLIANDLLNFDAELDNALLQDLVAMTPFAHKGHREKREALLQQQHINMPMAFSINLFQLVD